MLLLLWNATIAQEVVTSFGFSGSRSGTYDSSYSSVSPLVRFNASGNYYNDFKLIGELTNASNFGIQLKNVLYYNRIRAHANIGFGAHIYNYQFRLLKGENLSTEDEDIWDTRAGETPFHTYTGTSTGSYYGKLNIGAGIAIARLKSWEFSLLASYQLEARTQSNLPVSEYLAPAFNIYNLDAAGIRTFSQSTCFGWAFRKNSWEIEAYTIIGLSQQALPEGVFQYKLIGGGGSISKTLKVSKIAPDQYINDDYALTKTTVNKVFRHGASMWYYEATESQRDFEAIDLDAFVTDSFEVRGYGNIRAIYDRLLIRKTLKGSLGYTKYLSNRLALGFEFTSYEEEVYGRGVAGDENNNYLGQIAPFNPNDFKKGLFKSEKYNNSSVNIGLNAMVYVFDNEKIIDPFVQFTYTRIGTPKHNYDNFGLTTVPELAARLENYNYYNIGFGSDLKFRLRGTTYLNLAIISEYVMTPTNSYLQGSVRLGLYYKRKKKTKKAS